MQNLHERQERKWPWAGSHYRVSGFWTTPEPEGWN